MKFGKQDQQKTADPVAAAPAPAPEAPASEKHDLVILAPTPDLNPRNRAMAEIAKRSNADSDAAAKETIALEGEEPQALEAPPPAEAQEPEADPEATVPQAEPAAPASAAPAAAQSGIDLNADYDFVIDGKPVKLKGSQITARVQKGESADYRLELASRLLKEAEQRASQQQLPAQGATRAQPQASQQPALDEAQLANMIQFGTQEQAAQAIKALRSQRPDTVTQQGLQSFMVQQLPRIVESQLAFRDGLALAKSQYADIIEDPYLRQLFFFKENEARKAGDTRPHVELYKAIGEDLRKHFNRPAPSAASAAAPTAQAAQRDQKLAAKAAAPAAPRLASVRLEGGDTSAKPKTREEVIEQMRRNRGQQSLTTR